MLPAYVLLALMMADPVVSDPIAVLSDQTYSGKTTSPTNPIDANVITIAVDISNLTDPRDCMKVTIEEIGAMKFCGNTKFLDPSGNLITTLLFSVRRTAAMKSLQVTLDPPKDNPIKTSVIAVTAK